MELDCHGVTLKQPRGTESHEEGFLSFIWMRLGLSGALLCEWLAKYWCPHVHNTGPYESTWAATGVSGAIQYIPSKVDVQSCGVSLDAFSQSPIKWYPVPTRMPRFGFLTFINGKSNTQLPILGYLLIHFKFKFTRVIWNLWPRSKG